MVRFIIDNNAKTLEDIMTFNYDDYEYSKAHTLKANEPVFIR